MQPVERRLMLSAAAWNALNRPFTATEIVVAFAGNQGMASLQSTLAKQSTLRGQVNAAASRSMFSVDGSTLVEVKLASGADPKSLAQQFASLPGVKWAQPNFIYDDIDPRDYTPNDPLYSSQYHHPLMKNNLAWDTTLGISSIKIGVTDDGVLLNHPDLAANIWVNPGEIPGNGIDDDGNGRIDDVNGWDAGVNDNDPNPTIAGNDHGTHVAGIFSARTNNAVGVAGTAGGSTIVPIRFYGSGVTWTSTVVANAYQYAVQSGCHIVNTSYNVDGFSSDSIFAAGLQFMYNAGVLHFNSAGNNNQLNPARQRWDQSIFVASTTSSDTRSSFSNYGWGVDVSAPGSDINSTSIGTTLTAPNYEVKSGTSMSTPNAAGVAALIWSANPTWTREQVIAQLIATADNIDALNPSVAGLLGSGRVNSFRAVTETIAPPKFKTNSLTGLPAENGSTSTKPASFTIDVASVFDPATMNASAFEIRGDGRDNVFGTADDVLVPFNLVFGSASNANYMIGTNRLFFSGLGNMPADRYRFSALPTLQNPFGQALDGNGNGTGGDAFTRTFTLNGPDVTASSFAYTTLPHRLTFTFNQNVSASLTTADILVENLTTSQVIPSGQFSLSYNTGTNTATFSYTGNAGGQTGLLPNGNYRATLIGSGIFNTSSVTMLDYTFNFKFLQGDANGDGIIDFDDYALIDTGFLNGLSGYGNGDFNYDGVIDFDDYAIIDFNFLNQP
jgi:subtilisin family serine protease